MGSFALGSGLLVGGLVGCTETPKETPAKKEPVKKEPTKKEPAKKEKVAATSTKSHPECVGPHATAPDSTWEAAGRKFTLKGSTLTLGPDDPDDEFIVGQITDVKDYTPENAANIQVVKKWFKSQNVDAVAITGDLGESAESIENVILELVDLNVPILAIAGNRECREHFSTALKNVSDKHKHVVNMNKIRVLNVDDASIISMPGYYNRSYIHCAEGCEYTPADVKELDTFVKDATSPAKLLISHGPPKQAGETALDRIHEAVNVGDPELTAFLKKGTVPFGMFGNIQEAGGYATDLSGEKRLDQDAFHDKLYLNPGPIDAVRWAMLDGTESLGMAGLMKIKGKQASYKVYRIKAGEAKVSK